MLQKQKIVNILISKRWKSYLNQSMLPKTISYWQILRGGETECIHAKEVYIKCFLVLM
jgi:hypothetical protein